MVALQEGRSVTMLYDTTFLINWPEHLGGTSTTVSLHGSMVLIPLMGMM